MKYTGVFALSLAVALGMGCGKKDDSNGEGGGSGGGGGGAKCSEANAVKVAWNADEMYAPGAFEHSHTIGFQSGMVWNGKSVSKIGYAVIANYDVKLGPYMIDVPKEEGQQAILIQFVTDSAPVTMETQKAEYAKLELAPGEYKPADSGKAGLQLTYFVGGQSGGPNISSGATGGATLTQAKGALCGSIDFTTPKGSTFKGTFNAPITKDLWAK